MWSCVPSPLTTTTTTTTTSFLLKETFCSKSRDINGIWLIWLRWMWVSLVTWTLIWWALLCLNPLILSVSAAENTFKAHVGPLPFRQTEVGVVERLKGCVENHWVGLWTPQTDRQTDRRRPSTSQCSQISVRLWVLPACRRHGNWNLLTEAFIYNTEKKNPPQTIKLNKPAASAGR